MMAASRKNAIISDWLTVKFVGLYWLA